MSLPPGSAVPVTPAAAIIGGGVAVGAVPELALLAQFTAVGGLGGAGIALYRDRKHGPDGDRRFRIITAWTIVATLFGLVALAAAHHDPHVSSRAA